MLRRAIGPSPAERVLGAATARPTPAERALGAGTPTAAEKALRRFVGKPTLAEKFLSAEKPGGLTFEEKMLGVTEPGGRTFTEKMLGVGKPGGLTFEEKILGVTKPGGPTFTERVLGIKERGGKSPMDKLASMVTPPTVNTSALRMLEGMTGPAVETAFPQLDRSATSLFKTDPSEFTYVSDIDRLADEQDLDVVLDAELDVAEGWTDFGGDLAETETTAHYSAATDAIDEVRAWLAHFCPSALAKIEGASHAFDGRGPDFEAQVAVSCRRTLEYLADVLCPAVPEKKPDRNGTMRELGQENYGNRLLRYLDLAQVASR